MARQSSTIGLTGKACQHVYAAASVRALRRAIPSASVISLLFVVEVSVYSCIRIGGRHTRSSNLRVKYGNSHRRPARPESYRQETVHSLDLSPL